MTMTRESGAPEQKLLFDNVTRFSKTAGLTATTEVLNRAIHMHIAAPAEYVFSATSSPQGDESKGPSVTLVPISGGASNFPPTPTGLVVQQYAGPEPYLTLQAAQNKQDLNFRWEEYSKRFMRLYLAQAAKYQELLATFSQTRSNADEISEGENPLSPSLIAIADVLGEPAVFAMATELSVHRPGDTSIGITAAHLAAMRDPQTEILRISLLENLGNSHDVMDRYYAIASLGTITSPSAQVSLKGLAEKEKDQNLKQMALDFSDDGSRRG